MTPSLTRAVVVLCVSCLASSAGAHGSFDDRIAAATRQIEADPGNARLHLDRSVLYREHADYAPALADLERAASLDPTNTELDYFRGQLFLASGRHGAAAASLRLFVARWPDHPAANAALARALLALGEPLAAAAHYTRAIDHQPVQIPGHHLARARALVAAGRPDEALRGLDAGMERLGPVVSLALTGVEIELEQGRTDAALARLDRVARTTRHQETWLARRAEILERAGRSEPARATWSRVLVEIAGLPEHRRATPAVVALASRAHASLERLGEREE